MANLVDTGVNGDLRVTGTMFGTQAGNYATCATAAGTAAKAVTISGFTLTTGIHVFVKFTVTNTAAVASLTLNVSGTGAKAMKYRGGNLPAVGTLSASRVYEFIYDGTNWELVGDLDTNTQTVTGVKGNAESSYRTGQVNITPANIGVSATTTSVTVGDTTANIPQATTTTPKMDGTAAVGSETTWAKGDHVHPTDTSRAPTSHASSATTYGVGTTANYGHVKLNESHPITVGTTASNGVATGQSHMHNAIESVARASVTTADLDHIYTNSCAHMILSQITAETSTTHDPGDGYMLSFMWDNTGAHDAQVYIPDSGTASAVDFGRLKIRYRNNSTWGDWGYLAAAHKATFLTSSDNLNNLKGDGHGNIIGYVWESTSTPSNTAFSDNHGAQMFVFGTSGTDYCIQVELRAGKGIYQRRLTAGTWGSWEKVLVSGDVSVPSTVPTLAWNTESTLATIDGKDIKVKLPASPDTDTKVTQTADTSNDAAYPLLAKNTTATSTITDTSRFTSGVTLNPKNKSITATTFIGALSGNATTATSLYKTAISYHRPVASSGDGKQWCRLATLTEANIASGGLWYGVGVVVNLYVNPYGVVNQQMHFGTYELVFRIGISAGSGYSLKTSGEMGIRRLHGPDRKASADGRSGIDWKIVRSDTKVEFFIKNSEWDSSLYIEKTQEVNGAGSRWVWKVENGLYTDDEFATYCSDKTTVDDTIRLTYKSNALVFPRKSSFNYDNWTQASSLITAEADYNGATNAPSTNWFYLLSMQGEDTAYAGQIAFRMTGDPGLFIRQRKSSAWNSWYRLLTTGDVTSTYSATGTSPVNGTAVASAISGKSPTSHTHTVKINGTDKTIAATGGTAVNLGTYTEFAHVGDTSVIGNNSPAADCKTYFANNVSNGSCKVVYCKNGDEYTLIFSKQSGGQYGNILKYGYASKYVYILRYQNGTWKSDDWEKIAAGYADSAESATSASSASKVANKLTLKIKTGTTEGTDLYTYDGSGAKTLDIKQGSNITLTAAASSLTIDGTPDTKVTSADNHYTPATVSGQDKTASASGATAAWSIDVVKGVTLNTDGKGHVTGLSVTSGKIPANPNTDTKVTSAANHYAPETVSGQDKTASASGATAAWSIDVVKGVTLNTDGKGHVTGLSVTSGKIPANPNTDTKVTSAANHYAPETVSGQDKTASASGATAAWSIDVVKGVTLNTDGKGHVTGLSVTSGKIPGNPNTDTKVKATAKTDDVNYKILATASASPTSGNATEAVYDADISLNPSTNTISANISGNAATASKINTSAKIGDTNKPVYIAADGTVTPISYTIATSVPSGAVFTDTKVTSSGNHYTPATVSGSEKTASASGATAAWSIDVVKGITISTDGKGHITDLAVTSGKIPANPGDTKVTQNLISTNGSYPVILKNSTTATDSPTNTVNYGAKITANPSTGQLHATTFDVNSKCTLQFNTTTNALDFVFA